MSSLNYEGCNYFRMRVLLSTLSGKSIRISQIRPEDDDPGLKGETQELEMSVQCSFIF